MTSKQTMKIFRAIDAPLVSETDEDHEMTFVPGPPEEGKNAARMMEAGVGDGFMVKALYSAPGFSLVYVWFKKNFPLPRHSHNSDCLYYIISGEIKLGTEELGPGDGFFIPADAPYTYSIGETGVEILEFRHSAFFDAKNVGATQAYYDKAVKAIIENRSAWLTTPTPRPARRRAPA